MSAASGGRAAARRRGRGLALLAAVVLVPGLVTTGLAGGARAMEVGGINVPDTYVVDGTTLRLNGAGVRTLTLLEVKIYVAALYLTQPMHDGRAIEASPGPKVLTLRFLHEGSKTQVERQYRAGEQENCGGGGCSAADGPDFERLIALAPAVKVGDSTTYIFTTQGVTVLANDRVLAKFANPDLGFRLLNGFLGATPPSKTLRAALLGVSG